jgi:Retrotransposon gag protein
MSENESISTSRSTGKNRKKSKKNPPDAESGSDIEKNPQLSAEEVRVLLQQLKDQAKALKDRDSAPDIRKWKVPRGHPIFDGKSENLEKFISEMQFSHMEWVAGAQAKKDNPHFISKLLDYFSEKSGIREWFQTYATERINAKKVMSWAKLVKALRRDFSPKKQRKTLFNEFWHMEQGGDDIHIYIVKHKRAYAQARTLITDELRIVGFTGGLREDVQRHVSTLEPGTFEDATAWAIAYESNNILTTHARASGSKANSRSTTEDKNQSRKTEPEKKPLNKVQQKALDDLREARRGCYECGVVGHRRDACTATADAQGKHRKIMSQLRSQIHGKQ